MAATIFGLMTTRREELISLALLLALTLAMFGDVLFAVGTRVVGFQISDLFLQFLSWRDFGFRELAKGNLALWNPHIFSGAPYFGAMQAALLYPPNWLFLILPLSAAVNWTTALHVFAIGAFMFCWMRVRGLHVMASFLAGYLVMFCGAHFLHIFAGHLPHLIAMAWAPLIFCAIDGLFETRNFRWCFVGMFAVAMQILAGFPQHVFYTAIIAGLYSALRLIGNWNWSLAGSLLGIYPGGAALSAVQLLAANQTMRETVRGTPLPFEFASVLPFPPENFITLFVPNFFGEAAGYWAYAALSFSLRFCSRLQQIPERLEIHFFCFALSYSPCCRRPRSIAEAKKNGIQIYSGCSSVGCVLGHRWVVDERDRFLAIADGGAHVRTLCRVVGCG